METDSKLHNLMTRDKAGNTKELAFLQWARRCQAVREDILGTPLQRWHQHTLSHPPRPATEDRLGVITTTLSEEQAGECYRWLGGDMLKHDLWPSQKKQPKYRLKYNEQGRARHLGGIQCNASNRVTRSVWLCRPPFCRANSSIEELQEFQSQDCRNSAPPCGSANAIPVWRYKPPSLATGPLTRL